MERVAGWGADPSRRYLWRFYDGWGWTNHVSNLAGVLQDEEQHCPPPPPRQPLVVGRTDRLPLASAQWLLRPAVAVGLPPREADMTG